MNDYNGMIDYNGWIDVNMHYNEEDETFDDRDFTNFSEEMAPLISEFNNNSSRIIEFKEINWVSAYHIFGVHNHNTGYFDDVINVYKAIGEKAPGSFGLLYIRLPEHPVYWNQYRVFRLANGELTEHEDILLSPCRPTIEP